MRERRAVHGGGKVCVEQVFEEQSVGYFCFWKEGDTEHGAPAYCVAGGQPYVDAIEAAQSIDGVETALCGLAVSTCLARQQFRDKDCATTASGEVEPDDTQCGFAAPDDAPCQPWSVVYRCTMRCRSEGDCPPGGGCNTDTSEPYCEL